MLPASYPDEGFDRMDIYGDGWMAVLEPNPRPLTVWDDRRCRRPIGLEIRTDPVGPSGMLAEELRCFCRIVRGREAVPSGARYTDAMQIARWLENLSKTAADAVPCLRKPPPPLAR